MTRHIVGRVDPEVPGGGDNDDGVIHRSVGLKDTDRLRDLGFEIADRASAYTVFLRSGGAYGAGILFDAERILQAMKLTLAGVIKDTATPHGMRHPLSDATIEDLRQCLALISARERELAQAAGRPVGGQPRYADEPGRQVIEFYKKKP